MNLWDQIHSGIVATLAGICLLFHSILDEHLTLPRQFQLVVLGIAVLGLPHGAMDYLLMVDYASTSKDPRFMLGVYHLLYLAVMGIVYLGWQISPLMSLAVFVMIAIYHFGEEDALVYNDNPKLKNLMWIHYFSFGANFLTGIRYNQDEVSSLIQGILEDDSGHISKSFVTALVSLSHLHSLSTVVTLGIILYSNSKTGKLGSLELIFVNVIYMKFPFLFAFGFWFCMIHSIRHVVAVFKSKGSEIRKNMITIFHYSNAVMIPMLILVSYNLSAELESYDKHWVKRGVAVVIKIISMVTAPHALLVTLWNRSCENPKLKTRLKN
jgi:Brp/Blh family beta-carotene 15,15'-monooxygenase